MPDILTSVTSILTYREQVLIPARISAFSLFSNLKTLSGKKSPNKSLKNHTIKWSENKTATYYNAKTFSKSDIIEKQLFMSKFFAVVFSSSFFWHLIPQFRFAFLVPGFSFPLPVFGFILYGDFFILLFNFSIKLTVI